MKENFKGQFGISSVITACLLVGFLGFALGLNYHRLGIFYGITSENAQLPEDLDYTTVEELYDTLRIKYAGSLSHQSLLDGLKRGLVEASGDPFTEYLTQEQAKEFQESLDGEFSGIGAEIGFRESQLVIIAPLSGSPAEKAGLKAQDAILSINDESTAQMGLQEAVSKIRGAEGTDVTLTIVRDKENPRDITVTRSVITIPSVRTELKEGNVGYIELIKFSSDSDKDFREAAGKLLDQGAEKIILDVRDNPGGLLNTAVRIASEFLPSGSTIVEERRDGEVLGTQKATNGGILVGVPTIVLINGGSASASEIIAGALQDNGAARIVGSQSFGKGSVQELIGVAGGAYLKVTIARWHTPNGRNISEEGITPDITVEINEADIESDRDPQLDKAIELLR